MRLKRLELFGFKSFADRTVLDFDRSLSGIVGPNGCGKSNVVDAIRWSLGEQRPTSMRGAEMTDVIFKGSASRPPLGVAEVTMVFDNTSGRLDDRGPEVSVTRRVFKSGEGEYQIDGERVRLKDVREMLFDTGLGSRGYAVLEQGKIDAILSANPIDRRVIFEEAAGISRYRQRRKEAESRLKRVSQDMERLEDLVGELQTRSRSLKIQAGKAERYVEARTAWQADGVRMLHHGLAVLEADLGAGREALAETEGRAEGLRTLRDGSNEDVATREEEQSVLASEVDRLSGEASTLGEELRRLDERRAQLSERIHSWNEVGQQESERARELGTRLEERTGELDLLRTQAAELERKSALAQEERDARAAATRAIEEALGQTRERCEAHNQKALSLAHEVTAAKNTVAHLEDALEPLEERGRRAQARLEEARGNIGAAERELERLVEELASNEEAVAALETRAASVQQELRATDERVAECEEANRELSLERARAQSRVESLLDREEERAGLEVGARRLLEGASEEAGPEIAGPIHGLLADHLRTTTQYARALDAVLGASAQALVVDTPEDAERALLWLKGEERGQVSMVFARGFGDTAAKPVPPIEGVLGSLREFVEVEAGFEALADGLLRDVLLVERLDVARDLAARLPGWRFATPEGDLWDRGLVRGGFRDVAQGPVGRRSSAAELQASVADLDARVRAGEERLVELREERGRIDADVRRLAGELGQLRTEAGEKRAARDGASARLRDMREGLEAFEHEAASAIGERGDVERELAAARERGAVAERGLVVAREELQAADAERIRLEGEREERAREEAEIRIEATRSGEQLEGYRHRLRDLEGLVADMTAERERAVTSAESNRQLAEDGAGELETLSERRVDLLERRGNVESRLTESKERERTGRQAIDELRKRVGAVTHELEDLASAVAEGRLEVQRLELERADVLRRAEEDFQLEEEELVREAQLDEELRDEAAWKELQERVAELKRTLERIGPVNVEAVAELEEVTERLTFLETQRDDLSNSKNGLAETIRHIDRESERLFLEAFDEIRTNFQGIFRKLFGGGKADIVLGEEESPLDAGIEIVARAPGREMLPIGLLSGGQRTMTALALLFSVFQARPSPFCVLDEVDAALDDANIARFLVMLDEFRKTSQFVIVTHNKGTMAASEILYGVTMQTKGVSRVVSVALDEVDEFVPEATGGKDASEQDETPPTEVEPEVREEELVPFSPAGRKPQEVAEVESVHEPVEEEDSDSREVVGFVAEDDEARVTT